MASKCYCERSSDFVNNSLTTAKELDQRFDFAAFEIAADEQDIKCPKTKAIRKLNQPKSVKKLSLCKRVNYVNYL